MQQINRPVAFELLAQAKASKPLPKKSPWQRNNGVPWPDLTLVITSTWATAAPANVSDSTRIVS